MNDLFSSSAIFQTLPLPGADVSYLGSFELGIQPEALIDTLLAETPWRQENVVVWGKTFRQPRLVAWYGNPGKAYHYSGIALEPLRWTECILAIKDRVERSIGYQFNSVLLNYYRDQSDSMGLHSDDEKELGPRPVIASISLGAERAFILKSKLDPKAKPIRLTLASGSLLLMKGDTQKNYKHGILKQTKHVGSRVNLTFRQILS